MLYPRLIHEYLKQSAQQFPDKTAIMCEDESISYSDLDRLTDNLAHSLTRAGLNRQDRVIILLDNSNETVISLYGIAKAGGVFITLNGSLKAQKLAYIIDNSDAAMLITHTSKKHTIHQALQQSTNQPQTIWVGDHLPEFAQTAHPWQQLIADNDNADTPLHRTIDLDLATLIYTSGSTGDPKGVMSSHQNMTTAARSIAQYLDNTPNDIILCVLPLSFDYGLYQVLMSVIFGGTVIIEKSFMTSPRPCKRSPDTTSPACPSFQPSSPACST